MNKAFYKSKINWTGIVLLLLGLATDERLPTFLGTYGIDLPPWFIAEFMRWCGFILIIFRSFMTTAAAQQPGPDAPADVYLPLDHIWPPGTQSSSGSFSGKVEP
jgi:hypothetical protein